MAEEFNELELWKQRADRAQAIAAHAYARLLDLAEHHDTGQARRVARFIASTYNSTTFPFDLAELRAVDVALSDDMLACLDALRWGKADLFKLVPEGEHRVQAICKAWGIIRPAEQ